MWSFTMALDSDIMNLIGNSAQDSFPLPFPNEEQETNGFVRRGFTHILSLTRDPIALTVYHEQLSSLGHIEMVKSDSIYGEKGTRLSMGRNLCLWL